jgi:hypothetical protein
MGWITEGQMVSTIQREGHETRKRLDDLIELQAKAQQLLVDEQRHTNELLERLVTQMENA